MEKLKRNERLGAMTKILISTPNRIHTLGEFCFIGAGAVVTKDVKPYALMVGNPARQIGWMSQYGHRLEFDANGMAKCPECGDLYRLENEQVKKID